MFSSIPFHKTISAYNQAINIPLPKFEDFDVRDFSENMVTVRLEMPAFRHGFYQIALLESGGGKVSSGGKIFDLDNFTLFFIQPGQIIQWQVPKNWKGYYVSLSESFYTMALDQFKVLPDFPFFQRYTPAFKLKREEAGKMIEAFQSLKAEYENRDIHTNAIIKSYLATILGFSLRFYERESKDTSVQNALLSLPDRFKKALNTYALEVGAGLVNDHKSVSNFADDLAVSSKHLSETIKKSTGQSPIEHINQVLVEEAQKLLLTTDMSVKAVGYYLGFSSPSYFNRLFKKITNTSPAEFRKA
ncbi:helix-turn-helix domain-containing protein [Roseivirga misakiensis]|uniref:HTH araC/xylS-type domain-containing protein n=1 Tax=Roseivirga misakiensis TaxID=1563681 RepID=A0A1E5T6K8_9BACT|nr:helix-turn-helix domain-containing protein [Roseivirga misakiensis]OEK07015.1 hypothetical protein BFP71_04975 [Roseivirga misakiensis]